MIKIIRFNGAETFVNADLIEFVEETPDTVITLVNGKKIMVRDTAEELVNKVIKFKKNIFSNNFTPGNKENSEFKEE